jgi:hypothetical protein
MYRVIIESVEETLGIMLSGLFNKMQGFLFLQGHPISWI